MRHLGVSLGLETSGSDRAFGSLGDIALIAGKFSFVCPVIDWAHVHAKSGGALTTVDAFASVIEFLRSEFPGWAIDPLHTQFTDNEFGAAGRDPARSVRRWIAAAPGLSRLLPSRRAYA